MWGLFHNAKPPRLSGSSETISLNSNLLEANDAAEPRKPKKMKSLARKARRSMVASNTFDSMLSDSTLNIELSARYRKMKEDDANMAKIRKQAEALIEKDDLEGLLKMLEDENEHLEGREPLTIESPGLNEPRKNMTLLHSALEDGSKNIATYMIQNCSGKYLLMTYTNIEIQIPPSCKSCFHILVEQGDLKLIELYLVTIRKHFPFALPPFQALIQPILKDLPLEKIRKFLNEKVVVKAMQTKTRANAAHLAVANGHSHLLALLAKHEVDLNAEDSSKETPLMWSVKRGDLDCFGELLRLGVGVNCVNKFQCSALHLAITHDRVAMAERLIDDRSTDLNLERIKNPRWAVEMVAWHDYVPLMRKLMEPQNRVRISQANVVGALFVAARQGHEGIVDEILGQDEKITNSVDDFGNTPVMVAAENGNVSAVRTLVEKYSADLSLRNNFKETVYDLAMRQSSMELVKYLMDRSRGDQVCNPVYLHSAAASGDTEKLDFIIASGTKLLEPDRNDNTVFHTAAGSNAARVLQYYLHKDDDLTDLQNKDGETPLHVAVRKGHVDCVRTLLSLNASVEACDKRIQNALHVAVSSPAVGEEIVAALVARMRETYETLVNEQDCDGNTALHLAAMYRREDLMEHLVCVDPEVENTNGETALHVAVMSGTAREVKTLLRLFYVGRKRNVDRKDEKGNTALLRSVELGDAEKLELLLRHGADLALRGSNNSTCMHQMIMYNRKDLASSDRFIAIYHAIVKASVEWYCRKEGLKHPMECTREYYLYLLDAVRHLTSEMYYDKCNALQFASKLGTGDLLKAMLQTPDVYKFRYDTKSQLPSSDDRRYVHISRHGRILKDFLEDNNRKNNLALYDVSDLIPMTYLWDRRPKSLEVDVREGTKIYDPEGHRTAKSCLELIVNTNDENFINDVLDDEPFKFLVSKYWTLCRRGYEALMWLHVVYMILFTYFTLPTSEFLYSRFGAEGQNFTGDAGGDAGPDDAFSSIDKLGLFLTWPVFILLCEVAVGFYYLSTLRKRGRLLRKGLFGRRKISDITSGLMRIPVGTMLFVFDNLSRISSLAFGISSVTWYAMALYADNPHAYLESLSVVLVFGWLHTINYVKGFKDWNYLASILKEILIKDITRFIYVYIFVLISFGYAIHALIQADYHLNPDSRHPTSTIYLTFYRMLSPGNILDVSEERGYAESGGSVGVLRAVCAAYSVLSTVVLMNMLIAMMNSTYTDIKNNKSTAWRIESLKIALWFEQKIPFLSRWNLLGFSSKFDEDQQRWYLSKECTVHPDETYWENQRREKETKDDNGDDDDSGLGELEKKRGKKNATRQILSALENLNAQMETFKEDLNEKANDSRLVKIALGDLRQEIKRIHELSLETCTLSKLARRLE